MKKHINNEYIKCALLTLSLLSISALGTSSASTEYLAAENNLVSSEYREYTEQIASKPNARLGMTTDQVINETNWGKPWRINIPTNAYSAYGKLEEWVYSSGQALYFTNDHIASMLLLGANYYDDNYTKDFSKYIINNLGMTQKLAQKGDPQAQSSLGNRYQYNYHGVERDTKKAFELFLKSANQGHVSGQYNLSFAYRFGVGVPIDIKKADKWDKLAANNKDLSPH